MPSRAADTMIAQLRRKSPRITDPRVFEAIAGVPRDCFVPDDLRDQAWGDHPLPIGHGQTISQPYIVAWMTQALAPRPGDRVLEIGAGCGYQSAVLAAMGAEVYAIEIVTALAEQARRNLEAAGVDLERIHLRCANGTTGWPEAAPFDAILVACAAESVPGALIEQLRPGGRLVLPIGPEGGIQQLRVLEKPAAEAARSPLIERASLPVRFVPMVRAERQDRA